MTAITNRDNDISAVTHEYFQVKKFNQMKRYEVKYIMNRTLGAPPLPHRPTRAPTVNWMCAD